MRRLIGALRRFVDAILPRPFDDTDCPATEAEAARRQRQIRFRRLEKGGRGGNR